MKSILHTRNMVLKKVWDRTHRRFVKISYPEPLPAGRQGGGPKPEDITYLVNLYQHREEIGNLVNKMCQLSDLNTLTLVQLTGLPAKEFNTSLLTDRIASRIHNMLNGYQESWHFVFEPHLGGFVRYMRYKITDVELLGGQEFADLLDL